MKEIHFTLPNKIAHRLDDMAEDYGLSRSSLLRMIITDRLKKEQGE